MSRAKKWREMTSGQIASADWILRVLYTSPELIGGARLNVEMLHRELRSEVSRRGRVAKKAKAKS